MNENNIVPINCEINKDESLFHILLNTARPLKLYFPYICGVETEEIIIIDRYTSSLDYLFSEIITFTFVEGHKKIAVISGSNYEENYKDAKIFKMNIIKLTSKEREKGIANLVISDEWLYNKINNKEYLSQSDWEGKNNE